MKKRSISDNYMFPTQITFLDDINKPIVLFIFKFKMVDCLFGFCVYFDFYRVYFLKFLQRARRLGAPRRTAAAREPGSDSVG